MSRQILHQIVLKTEQITLDIPANIDTIDIVMLILIKLLIVGKHTMKTIIAYLSDGEWNYSFWDVVTDQIFDEYDNENI